MKPLSLVPALALAPCAARRKRRVVALRRLPAALRGPAASAAAAALAPTGACAPRSTSAIRSWRAAIRSPAPAGVSVDLARALAAQLGVPASSSPSTALRVRSTRSRAARPTSASSRSIRCAATASASPRPTCSSRAPTWSATARRSIANAEVDRAGTRIVVGRGSAYDLYLSRELKAAQLVRTPTSPAVVDAFLRRADVAAGVKQQLQADAARVGGIRLLPGRFMVIEQAMGVPAGRGRSGAPGARRSSSRPRRAASSRRRCSGTRSRARSSRRRRDRSTAGASPRLARLGLSSGDFSAASAPHAGADRRCRAGRRPSG